MLNVTIILPRALAEIAGGSTVSLDAASLGENATLGAALRALDKKYPRLYDYICNEQREARKHVLIYIDDTESRLSGGLDTPLKGGETILVVAAVSGG